MNTTPTLTRTLDRLETDLPDIAAKSVALSRATVRRTTSTTAAVLTGFHDLATAIGRSVSVASKTACGQAKSASNRAAKDVRNAAAETIGQARAQAGAVADSIESETSELLDDAVDAVDPATVDPNSLDDLSKSELYERARVADIEGRSSMTKDDLVAALRRN